MKSTWDYEKESARFEDEPELEDLEFCAECGMTYLPHTMTLVHGFYYRPEYMCHDCLNEARNNRDGDTAQWTDNDDGSVTFKFKNRKPVNQQPIYQDEKIDLFKMLGTILNPGGTI